MVPYAVERSCSWLGCPSGAPSRVSSRASTLNDPDLVSCTLARNCSLPCGGIGFWAGSGVIEVIFSPGVYDSSTRTRIATGNPFDTVNGNGASRSPSA